MARGCFGTCGRPATLRWQDVSVCCTCCCRRCQESQPLPSITPPRAGRTVRPDAQYRWQLLRLAVKFHMAYRWAGVGGVRSCCNRCMVAAFRFVELACHGQSNRIPITAVGIR